MGMRLLAARTPAGSVAFFRSLVGSVSKLEPPVQIYESDLPEAFILDLPMRACRFCRPPLCRRKYRAACDRTKGRP